MIVIKTTKAICDEFVSKKHYSRTPSIFWAGFALVEDEKIVGVVVYGQHWLFKQKQKMPHRF
jgi:hypothetical protein